MRPAAITAEALAGERLIHHAEHRLARAQQGDQCAPGRHAADERLRAVDGIEDPDVFGVGAVLAEFLTDDAVVREGTANERAHRRFGRVIGGGHGIETAGAPFVLNAQRRAEEWQDRFARDRCKLVDESREVDRGHASPPAPAIDLSKTCAPGNLSSVSLRRCPPTFDPWGPIRNHRTAQHGRSGSMLALIFERPPTASPSAHVGWDTALIGLTIPALCSLSA